MKKNSSNVIYIVFLLFVIIIFIFYNNKNTDISNNLSINLPCNLPSFYNLPCNLPSFYNLPDVLLNPYSPPLRDERYLVPINVPTNIGSVNTNYRQMGILTPFNESSTDKILQLMGRPLFLNRDKWQYYTISNTGSINTKLPIRFHGRNCSGEYGCDSLMNGDIVYVEGYQDTFQVTLYETAKFQYIPYI